MDVHAVANGWRDVNLHVVHERAADLPRPPLAAAALFRAVHVHNVQAVIRVQPRARRAVLLLHMQTRTRSELVMDVLRLQTLVTQHVLQREV